MHVVLGATGRVGRVVVDHLLKAGCPVRMVVRSSMRRYGDAQTVQADLRDADSLIQACKGGSSILLLTPEDPFCPDIRQQTSLILENYRRVVKACGIKRLVLLSSLGAQHEKGTGTLGFSYQLEHAFDDLNVERIAIRSAYYYSNWLRYWDEVLKHGVLPSFFPPDFRLPMVDPQEVGAFCSLVMQNLTDGRSLYEVVGPRALSASDIAASFSRFLNRPVTVLPFEHEKWVEVMREAGFSSISAELFAQMTQAVLEGKTEPVTGRPVECQNTFDAYLEQNARK